MKQVLVRPLFSPWCDNRLFIDGTSYSGVYKEAFSEWRKTAAKAGFKLNTWDKAPLDQANIFWFLDLPKTRQEFEDISSQLKPNVPIILQILESPLSVIHAFTPKNTHFFDAVLSYEYPEVIDKHNHYFHYHLPNHPQQPKSNIPYEDRRGLLILNSNVFRGFWSSRQQWLIGIPGFGKLLSGWDYSPAMLKDYSSGELYSQRRKLARLAEKIASDFLDIYGKYWNGEKVSWFPFYPNSPYHCWRGFTNLSKQALCEQYRFVLAFENFQGSRGYISEKIFDPMFAGSVPVYLGDERISEYVPPETFVDARSFRNYDQLVKFLVSCPKDEWNRMRTAGLRFIQSESALPFYTESFVGTAMKILERFKD